MTMTRRAPKRSAMRALGVGPPCAATPSTPAGSRPAWAVPAPPTTFTLGHVTQAWLAASDEPAATTTVASTSPGPDREPGYGALS